MEDLPKVTEEIIDTLILDPFIHKATLANYKFYHALHKASNILVEISNSNSSYIENKQIVEKPWIFTYVLLYKINDLSLLNKRLSQNENTEFLFLEILHCIFLPMIDTDYKHYTKHKFQDYKNKNLNCDVCLKVNNVIVKILGENESYLESLALALKEMGAELDNFLKEFNNLGPGFSEIKLKLATCLCSEIWNLFVNSSSEI